MARKAKGAPWFKVAVTFKLRRPRAHHAVKALRLPDRWQYSGIGGPATRTANLIYGLPEVLTSQFFTFEYDGFRPPIEDGELILARMNMLPETD